MQKLIIKNKYQSPNRINILTAAGIAQINEPIFPQNGERIWGGLGVVTFNQVSQYSEEENPNDPITPPNCPNCGGGIQPEPSVQPGANCEKKNISELKQILDDYANQSFCDKEFPDVQFSTFIGYDSTAQEIELRMLCPSDECNDDDLCDNPDNLPVNPVSLNNKPALYAIKFTVRLSCNNTDTTLDEYSFYDVFKVEPNTTTDKYDAGGYNWYYNFYPEDLVNTVQGWYDELVGCSSSSCACCADALPISGTTWGNGSGSGGSSNSIYLFGASCCRDLDECSRHRWWRIEARKVPLAEACENLRKHKNA